MAGEVEYASLSDEALVELAKKSDSSAFEQLVMRHRDRVYGQIFKMLANREEARDISQEVWVKVWSKLDQFQGDSPFTTWATRIAINTCLDLLRKRQRRPVEESIEELTERCGDGEWVPVVDGDPLAGLARSELGVVLEEAFESLPAQQQEALRYMYYEQMEYKEIAAKMNCSTGTVMSRLYYGKKALVRQFKTLLEEKGIQSDFWGDLS